MRVQIGAAAGVLSVLCLAAPAFAQLGAATINRPSYGPSSRLGLIGRTGGAVTGGNQAFDPFSQLRRDTTVANEVLQGTGTFRRGRHAFRAPLRDPSLTAVQPSELGASWTQVRSRPVNRLFRTMPTEGNLREVSGLSSAMSFQRQAGYPLQTEPMITRSYIRAPMDSTYHNFFGIVQSKPEEAEEEPRNYDPLARPVSLAERGREHLLEAQHAQRLIAIQSFRDATSPGSEITRSRDLDVAAELLERAKRSHPEDFESRLLLAHIALERNQVAFGLENLAEAVRCHPEMFLDRLDVGSYFGDRAMYERQLRRHLQAGTSREGSPESIILEAYCAFMLGDTARAASAAERAHQASTERSYNMPLTRDDVGVLAFAIKAATAR